MSDIGTHSIKFYPNPVSSVLTIRSENVVDLIRVYDVNGRLRKTLMPNSEMISLDVSNLVEGLYFMEVKSKDGIQMLKFVRK